MVHPPTPPWLPIRSWSWSWMIDSHPFRSMSISPHPPPPPPTFLKWGYFKPWPWNYKVKVMGVVKGQDHTVSPVSNWFAFFLVHINQITIQDTAILKFHLEISKVKVMGEVKGQGHIVHPESNRCTSFSFSINRTNHSWDMSNGVFKNTSDIIKENLAKKVSNRIPPKSNQVISMTRGI